MKQINEYNETEVLTPLNKIYVCLCSLFCCLLVTGNLVFLKTVYITIPYLYRFDVSVGCIIYPCTFLIIDIISEIYGKKHADLLVRAGLLVSCFVTGLVYLANILPATEWSMFSNQEFNRAFGFFDLSFFASMCAFLISQTMDIRIFLQLKRLTHDKHLWLRNSLSTIISQAIDTSCVLLMLCAASVFPWSKFGILLASSFLLKIFFAVASTPVFYLVIYLIKKFIEEKKSYGNK